MKLDRRTLLRGAVGGAAVSIGLPPLEIFFNTNGTAYASGAEFPRRLGIFFWGNGLADHWVPSGDGRSFTFSEQLAPLEAVRSKITIVTGMNVQTGNTIPHSSGPAGILSGAPLIIRGSDETFSAPSIDQVAAAKIGGETRFRSLELGARPEQGLSYNGPDSLNPPESAPARFFERIFGGGFRAPGGDSRPDPKLRLRRSVLDAIMGDAKRLRTRLGGSDQTRLDQHFEGIRELERRLARIEEHPPMLASCRVPAPPAEDYPPIEGRPQLSAISRAMSDILAMALACDQARVFSHFFSYPVNNLLFPGAPAGHHQLTHDEPGDQPQVIAIVKQIMAELAHFIDALDAVTEGEGTLLSSSAILATSDVSFARTHSLENYPIIIAGSACGALKTGIHYRSPSGENTSKVLLTLLRTVGLTLPKFGVAGGEVSDGLGAIEA